MCIQDSQIGNCEVYDHGVFIFEDFGVTVSLKELLPARLRGRQVMAPNDGIEGTFKVQKGYHDAPCIDKPMCICFCKLTMPKVSLHLVLRHKPQKLKKNEFCAMPYFPCIHDDWSTGYRADSLMHTRRQYVHLNVCCWTCGPGSSSVQTKMPETVNQRRALSVTVLGMQPRVLPAKVFVYFRCHPCQRNMHS